MPPEGIARGLPFPADCDGIITHVHHPAVAAALRRARCPVVGISRLLRDDPLPHVGVDDGAVGGLAAAHLAEAGLRRYAFVGLSGLVFSELRLAGFTGALRPLGAAPRHRVIPTAWLEQTPPPSAPRLRAFDRWLAALPRPVGFFAANDVTAWFVTERCRALRLRVPLDVAVLGVDDDDVLCELSLPPLSSVVLPAERVGFLAAQAVERAARRGSGVRPVALPPVRVAVRQSTRVQAVDDPMLAEALAFIARHATAGIGVEDVLDACPLGRRILERRFRTLLRRSVHEEIQRVRVDAARRLLATSAPIESVARRCGFSQASYFGKVFRRHTGLTPRAFRRLSG